MRGFKAFDKNLCCKGLQYTIGGEMSFKGKPIICEKGFHFCTNIANTYKYYPMSDDTRICEIEATGDIVTEDNEKYCTNKIVILREITDLVAKHCNQDGSVQGYCNTGDYNTGDRNTGSYNTGNRNTGNRNTGYYNTGNRNTGYYNTGDRNTGDRNTGNRNTGYYNTGDRNTGDRNTGYYNTGDWNTGDRNTGYYNTGNRNTGDYNTGNRNTGDYNTGNRNTGNRNTGDWNTGSYNTGDWNYCDYSSGVFGTENKNIKFFDVYSDWTYDNWLYSRERSLLNNIPTKEVMWINKNEMTDEEKVKYPTYKTTGGYLKVIDETETRQKWWEELSETDKNLIMSLPNFDAKKFKLCTGIDVTMK